MELGDNLYKMILKRKKDDNYMTRGSGGDLTRGSGGDLTRGSGGDIGAGSGGSGGDLTRGSGGDLTRGSGNESLGDLDTRNKKYQQAQILGNIQEMMKKIHPELYAGGY